MTPDAPWLPPGGRAEVIRRSTPPAPMCVVRLLLRRSDQVFCVSRSDTGRLDLPMRLTAPGDPSGTLAIAELAVQVTDDLTRHRFEGAVRNVVEWPQADYAWPTPHAYFGVWVSDSAPVVDGVWVGVDEDSPLLDRHWFPLATTR